MLAVLKFHFLKKKEGGREKEKKKPPPSSSITYQQPQVCRKTEALMEALDLEHSKWNGTLQPLQRLLFILLEKAGWWPPLTGPVFVLFYFKRLFY